MRKSTFNFGNVKKDFPKIYVFLNNTDFTDLQKNLHQKICVICEICVAK